MRIVVAGWTVQFPVAGFLWHPVAYVLGLLALGHDVYYLDDSGDEPEGYDPRTGGVDVDCRYGIAWLSREMEALGLADRWCFRHMPTGRCSGLSTDRLVEVLGTAECLVDVSLTLPMRPEYLRIPHRIGIDTDPVFTQVRLARSGANAELRRTHTRLFTFGRPPLPAQDGEWLATRQPVALPAWPVAAPPADDAPFTTVTTWRAYPPVEWRGVGYEAKDRSFAELLALPSLTAVPLEVALGGGSGSAEGERVLRRHGWRVTDALAVSADSARYRSYIAGSRGELGVAKHGYVAARSGWFSERTCCFLASGRPAVVQDTGWTEWLPSGEGLLAFDTPRQAAAALEAVRGDQLRHARGARRLVEEHFDATVVCADLLERGV